MCVDTVLLSSKIVSSGTSYERVNSALNTLSLQNGLKPRITTAKDIKEQLFSVKELCRGTSLDTNLDTITLVKYSWCGSLISENCSRGTLL